MAIHPHGTPAKCGQGCRCNLCQLVHAMYDKHVSVPTGSIPAGPTREHVRKLRDNGWRVREIAELSGYHEATIRALSNGHKDHIDAFMAEDLMSIPVMVPNRIEAHVPNTVPVAPILEHIDALRSAGVSMSDIARRSGLARTGLYYMIREGRRTDIGIAQSIMSIPVPMGVAA